MRPFKNILFNVLICWGFVAPAQFSPTNPQGLYVHNDAYLFIRKDNTLHIDGNFNNKKALPVNLVRSNGTISLTGNLICTDRMICQRASATSSTCKFIFTPKTDTVSIISNDSMIILYHVILNKPNTVVKLGTGSMITILDTLDFQGGSIQLAGGVIHLKDVSGTPTYTNHPYLKNERHSSRIFGDEGYIQMNPLITSGTANVNGFVNPGNLGLLTNTLSVSSATVFTIKRGHAKQIYAGNGSIARYFDVTCNKSIVHPIKINYIDSAEYINLGINRNNFKVFASTGNDMDYFELVSTNTLTAHLAEAATNTFTLGNINPKSFRVTVADNVCNNPPISSLPTGTIHLCAGQTFTLDAGNNTSIPNSSLIWNWSTGATTQTLAVTSTTATQQFSVTLRDVRGCIVRDTVFIAPTAPTPVATIYPVSKCFGDSVKLKSTSTISSGSIVNYFWQFGDATTYTTTLNDTIKKLYASPGAYSIALTVTSNYGCTSTIIQGVSSFPLPSANFTAVFDCLTHQMDFTSTSTVSPVSGSITNNNWNFNTAASSSLTPFGTTTTATYSYTPGNYNVKLFVKTGYGCKDSITKSITIYPQNTASFTVSNACLGDTVSFLNNSVCNTGSCNYNWSFGDGNQSIATNSKHTYLNSGLYNVKLKVLNAFACADSVNIPVIIHPKPLLNFSTTSPVCLGNVSYFISSYTLTSGTIASYNWSFGNSLTSANQNPSLTYTTPGNYNVNLSATSSMGCSSSTIQTVIIAPKPVAQYNVANVCFGQPSLFNDNSIGSNLSYLWDFGNTISSTLTNPSYIYPSIGSYSTSLIITNPSGCSDTALVNTIVYSIPNPSMSGPITTCGTTYTLNAGTGLSYLWQPLNATTQTVVINTNGNYSVTVTDANGCIGKDQVYVGLSMPVKPHLGNDTISCGPYIINAGYPGSTYLWSTPSQTLSTSQTFLATLASTYIVTVTDQNNCVGKDTVIVGINTPPTLTLGPDITQCKTLQPLTLIPVTNASVFLWSNGSSQTTLPVTNSGNYALTVTATNGCKKTDTINVNLLPSPIVNLGADASACASKLLDAQNIGFNYMWSTNITSQTITALNTGAYSVIVTNPSNGCFGTDTINLTISTPIVVALGNDTSTCSNNTIVLNAGNFGSSYNWSNGAVTQTIVTGSTGGYAVTVTNGACSAFDAVTVTVLNAPVVNLGNSIKYLCGNGYVTLNSGFSGSVIWGSSNGFSSNQPAVNVTETGSYWVTVSNGACFANDTVEVIQSNQILNAYFIASTVDTVGKPVKFVDVSEPAPTSWAWDFGDGFSSTEQSPQHIYQMPQSYSVTLMISNGFCESSITKSLQVLRTKAIVPKNNPSNLELLNFLVYPNPTDKSFKTVIELNDIANIDFSIYDVTGKMVYKLFKNQVSVFDEEIDVDFLKNGLYLIDVIAESNKGFVKQQSKLVIVK